MIIQGPHVPATQTYGAPAPQVPEVVPQHQPLIGTASPLKGITSVDSVQYQNPFLLVLGAEKCGKSTLAITLFGYPTESQQPLVIAADPSGPDSCLAMGYRVHKISVGDRPGAYWFEKIRNILEFLEGNKATIMKHYGALILDDVSTVSYRLLEEARRRSKNPDPRSHYQAMYQQLNEIHLRLADFGLPLIYFAWSGESYVNDAGLQESGGADIAGKKLARLMAGRAHHIVILEKYFMGKGQPGADVHGFGRRLHTTNWNGLNAGGRLGHLLPEPMPADLSEILWAARGQ